MQDSIGRHDTFGTACSLKTYEDQGYFGHVNCSDNFNYSLSSYVEKRNAWQAVNLFWNTGIDNTNVFTSEMPWWARVMYYFNTKRFSLCFFRLP